MLVKETVTKLLVGLELDQLIRGGAERIVTAPFNHLLELRHFFFALEILPNLQQRRAPAPCPLFDYRHKRFARHVAAKDQNVSLIVLAGGQELSPEGLGAVDV